MCGIFLCSVVLDVLSFFGIFMLGKRELVAFTTVVHVLAVMRLQQGSHRLEEYLNIQDCLEKSLK